MTRSCHISLTLLSVSSLVVSSVTSGEELAVETMVGAVSVSAALGREGSIATIHSALVHQLEVDTLVVDLDCEVVGEHLATVHTSQRILLVNRNISLQ